MPDRQLHGPLRVVVTAGAGILNADMATVGRWLGEGWRWWTHELAAMLPTGLRAKGRLAEVRLAPDGAAVPPSPARYALLIPASACLVRRIVRPPVPDRDIGPMLTLEGDRLFPLSPAALLTGWRVAERADNRVVLEIAAWPRDRAEPLLRRLAETGRAPRAVLVDTGQGRIDLTQAAAAAGLSPSQGPSARLWWAIAATVFALNIGLLVWRDVAATDRLATLVAEQEPAVAVARRMSATIRANGALGTAVIDRRSRRNALGMLDAVSGALPASAWVQRYAWDGATVRVVGYKRREDDIAAALRGIPALAAVRSTTADALADVPAGQPFDVSARVRGG